MDPQTQKQRFDDWLVEHKNLFFKVVRAYAFTPQDRDDLFQEIALQVWDSIPNYRGDSKTTTWIYRVALYTAVSWTKREKKHRGGLTLEGDVHALAPSTTSSNSRLDWLYDQIAQLNEIDRSLTLLMLDGFSYKEIAATLGISESNVGVKLSRIKKHLASKSEKRCRDGL
jgi:RNA polymerase sigma-70 factor (ECF subfamily)